MQINGMAVYRIESDAALRAAAAKWLQCPWVALDTEFMRVRTFYARAALFQLCDGESCYLIDPLAVSDLEPLAEVLRAPGIGKIMHSCSEDLEVCERRLGALPDPLIDTQIVAAFCGNGLSAGYARMLAQELGIEVDKSATRTDWLQRPLTEAQVSYAAEDVAYLPRLWQLLRERLGGAEREGWAEQECAAVLRRFRQRDSESAYRDMGGAGRLGRRSLAVLQVLHAWREETARNKDLPRSWVLPDAALLQLAELQPRRLAQLEAIEAIPHACRRRHGEELIERIAGALALEENACPEPLPPPLNPAQNRLVKKLRVVLQARAESLGVAPEMLARRRELEDLVRVGKNEPAAEALAPLQGWRRAEIGESLLEYLRSEST